MKDGGGGAELGSRLEGGSESSSMIVLQVILPRMEHQTKRKRRRAYEGCGRWRLIPDTADDRTTPVEGIGRGQKGGWSVVCEYLHASQRAQSLAGQQFFFFFFENLLTPGGPTYSGSVIPQKKKSGCLHSADSFFLLFSSQRLPALARCALLQLSSKLPPLYPHEHAKNNNELIPA